MQFNRRLRALRPEIIERVEAATASAGGRVRCDAKSAYCPPDPQIWAHLDESGIKMLTGKDSLTTSGAPFSCAGLLYFL